GNYVCGFTNFQFLGGELRQVDMNASRTGSSETVYFGLTDLRLHIRTTIRIESPAIKLICVRFSALKGFIVSGRVPDLMERPKMKSDVVPGQNLKGGDFPAVSAPGLKYKAALSVAYGAGLRAAEVISLKIG